MKAKTGVVLLACGLVACAQPPAPPPAAPPPSAPPAEAAPPPAPRVTSEAQVAPGRWNVERVRCSDLLGAADDDRVAAAMFYYGYLAAKAGIRVIDVSQIDGNIRKVMDRCAAQPNITVPQAFRLALGRRH
jgi:HdeA/HdeB family